MRIRRGLNIYKMKNNLNSLGTKILGCAIEVHRVLGPGLLESTYEACLEYELTKGGLYVERQKTLPLEYKDVVLDCGYRIDLLVENKIVLELKAVKELTDLDLAQIITYLKLNNLSLGYLLNFNVLRLKKGIKRVVNNFDY